MKDKRDDWEEESFWDLIPDNGLEIIKAISNLQNEGEPNVNQISTKVDPSYNTVEERLGSMSSQGLITKNTKVSPETYNLNKKSRLILRQVRPLMKPEGKFAQEKIEEIVREKIKGRSLDRLRELSDNFEKGDYGDINIRLSKAIHLSEESEEFKDIFASLRTTADTIVENHIQEKLDEIEEKNKEHKENQEIIEDIAKSFSSYNPQGVFHGGLKAKCKICGEETTLTSMLDTHFRYNHEDKELKAKYVEEIEE